MTKLTRPLVFACIQLVLLLAAFTSTARAQIYIAYADVGLVSKYDQQTGALIEEQFILGLKKPRDLCVANGVLYVLQVDTGTIGTYNLQTGAPIRPELVTGLNMPQVMTVSGDAIYVTEFDWQKANQPHIGKYNAFTGAAINASFITIAGAVVNGMTMTPWQPTALAANSKYLFAGLDMGTREYDATTGAAINENRVPKLFGSDFLLLDDKWLYLVAGTGSTAGMVFKTTVEPSQLTSPLDIFMRPFMNALDHPRLLAISGDDLFLSQGSGTGVARYNATSGAIINANFIPSKGDTMGGLAVVPRTLTADEASAESQFEFKQSAGHLLLMMAVYWQYTFLGTCLVFLLFVCGVLALLFRRGTPTPVVEEPAVEEPAAEEPPAPDEVTAAPIAEELPIIEESPSPVEPPPTPSTGCSAISIIAVILMGITLVTAGGLIYYILVPPDIFAQNNVDDDSLGVWSYDNNGTRDPSDTPIMRDLSVSPTHANYSEGDGPHDVTGKWHDNGFWAANADGSGETEVARLIDPLDMEVHVAAFYPGRTDVVTLYKVQGSAAEKAAIAAKYPTPLTYPPAKGVITYNMTEYDLNSLPWRVQYIEAVGDVYSRGTLYHYRSDDPKIPPLEVTVKLHHVIEIQGGYE
jgi:hypothetical protein